MKTTLKEHNAKTAEMRRMKSFKEDCINYEDFSMAHLVGVSIDQMQKEYFDKLPTVSAQFWIGSRKYYNVLVKIGKQYFDNGNKMTKSSGYGSIIEIPEITEKMNYEMLDDMYYY